METGSESSGSSGQSVVWTVEDGELGSRKQIVRFLGRVAVAVANGVLSPERGLRAQAVAREAARVLGTGRGPTIGKASSKTGPHPAPDPTWEDDIDEASGA